jgi:hypothetical protein
MSYRIDVYNHDLERIYVLDLAAIRGLSFDRKLNDVSACAFGMTASDSRAASIQRDYIFNIWRDNGTEWLLQGSYLQLLFDTVTEEDGETVLLFGGLSLEQLLLNRVIDPRDDPAQANGYSTKSGAAETVMQAYILEQAGASASAARQVPSLSISTDLGRGTNIGWRLRLENLLEKMRDTAYIGQIDFRLYLDETATIVFETDNIGTDKSRQTNANGFQLFSVPRGTVYQPRLTRDYRGVKNIGLVLGPGQGENRRIYDIGYPDAVATPFSRAEMVIDASSSDPGSSLQAITEGYARLYENQPKISYQFEVIQTANSVYDVDWFLGDTVTTYDPDSGAEFHPRIIQITVEVNEDSESIKPTFEVRL